MGLTLYVGVYEALGDGTPGRNALIRSGLKEINDLLGTYEIPAHEEAVKYSEGPGLWVCNIRYGIIEAFQEFVADLQQKKEIDVTDSQLEHLVQHSPASGYYLPIDYSPFVATEDLHLGSSYQLKRICEKVMNHFKFPTPLDQIPFDYTEDADDIWNLVHTWLEQSGQSTNELTIIMTCILLYQGCELSIRNNMIFGFN